MPELPGVAVGAVVDPARQHHPPADSGADVDVEQRLRATARPEPRLTQRRRVGVILEHCRQPERCAQRGRQFSVGPALGERRMRWAAKSTGPPKPAPMPTTAPPSSPSS